MEWMSRGHNREEVGILSDIPSLHPVLALNYLQLCDHGGGVVTFGEQKSFTNKAGASFFSEIKNEQHKIRKEQHFICYFFKQVLSSGQHTATNLVDCFY